ncbi:hypothetical protein ILYODFUR_037322 [Ilyodon furcidens]|uniref:Uncharacterized protein n=1 Tax=Ilyodon furcidens TaxID=33524 RepID=A0ABV0T4S3_9TELE
MSSASPPPQPPPEHAYPPGPKPPRPSKDPSPGVTQPRNPQAHPRPAQEQHGHQASNLRAPAQAQPSSLLFDTVYAVVKIELCVDMSMESSTPDYVLPFAGHC